MSHGFKHRVKLSPGTVASEFLLGGFYPSACAEAREKRTNYFVLYI